MSAVRIPWLLVVASLLLWGRVIAATPKSPGSIEDVAQCALNCLDQFLDGPIISQASKKRLCHDTSFNLIVTNCVRKACDVEDVLEYLRMEQNVCGRPSLDNDHSIRALNFFILGVAVTAVALRITTKVCRFTRWGLDDYFIIAAAAFTFLQCGMMIATTYEGLGHNIWTLDEDSVKKFFVYVLVVEFAYVLSLCLIKVSILCFFHRTFPAPLFRTIIIWTIGFTVLSAIVVCILASLQTFPTQPTQQGWKDDTSTHFKLDTQSLVLSHAGINVALDIWMFILPLTQLYHIGLKTKKKIGVILIFSVGIFPEKQTIA
ncbi:integral membrane protein [Fusarium heterosporum]|uniref:Integral membrane protein n=1 Tax=Fusarium heterosporum TaxID=42747 RepID=A0A8H5TZE3_FUSHE|nr:integral membrane protein [Fusarium heterosporum]